MTIQQFNPPHPGELIKRTYIDPFGDISANQIAKRLGVAVSTFNRLINGVSDISPEMAIRLSKVLGRSPESWLLLQNHYDLWKARQAVNTDELEPIKFETV
ncbi:addiction module HigA family antidote [Nitrosomonas oligotropha]|uniref:Addiction module HigA family antidote n=1 Tax=Nitrosomonas oligotropha TaxID=42354 RepID=A0A2T5I1F2_9PROT|nr:HigA family addiction module antitoxin [Nitrosomonas oligotropha]PTQ77598.1 addiction module HigA family antidote [Nitrosomonas oligotropha]